MLIDIAINVLWLLIGVIVLLGVLWLCLYAVKMFGVEVPATVEKGIYVIALILIIIAALSLLAGRGAMPSFFRHGAIDGRPLAAVPATTPTHHAVKQWIS
jgi:uncharacterized YccA/Bax inhibitor family protein